MTIQRAALLAAVGVLLRGLHYWVANLIPSWNSSGVMEQVAVAMVAIVDPLVWSYYFVSVWRNWPKRIPGLLAAVLGIGEIGFAVYRQWESFSWMSLETMMFVFLAVIPVICWTFYLLGKRLGLWYLLVSSLIQVALFVYQVVSSAATIAEFWSEEPWQLLVAPLIWIVYWMTQTLFVRAAQKA